MTEAEKLKTGLKQRGEAYTNPLNRHACREKEKHTGCVHDKGLGNIWSSTNSGRVGGAKEDRPITTTIPLGHRIGKPKNDITPKKRSNTKVRVKATRHFREHIP